MPIGDMSLTASSMKLMTAAVNYASTGAALTKQLVDSLGLGFESTSNDSTGAATEGEAYSATYSTTVGSASVTIGYTGFDAGSAGNTSSKTDVTLSQSIGGGASVFAEIVATGAGAVQQTLQVRLLQLNKQASNRKIILLFINQGYVTPGFFLFIFD